MQATNADWKPSVSTRSGFAPSFPARKSSERETAIVETMATPSAPPIWKAVLLRPDATPDSRSETPARAAIVAVAKAGPMPRPKTSRPRIMSPK
jgi:hypothetical protein